MERLDSLIEVTVKMPRCLRTIGSVVRDISVTAHSSHTETIDLISVFEALDTGAQQAAPVVTALENGGCTVVALL
jgi:hypothetical protein